MNYYFFYIKKLQIDYQIYDWRDRVTEVKRGIAMNPPTAVDLKSWTV
jgi:hypothetical protein